MIDLHPFAGRRVLLSIRDDAVPDLFVEYELEADAVFALEIENELQELPTLTDNTTRHVKTAQSLRLKLDGQLFIHEQRTSPFPFWKRVRRALLYVVSGRLQR